MPVVDYYRKQDRVVEVSGQQGKVSMLSAVL